VALVVITPHGHRLARPTDHELGVRRIDARHVVDPPHKLFARDPHRAADVDAGIVPELASA
jgi:hypothetical protein